MTGRRTPPIHLGGPIGLAGLTVLAAAAGLMVVAGNENGGSESAGNSPAATVERVEAHLPAAQGKETAERIEKIVTAQAPKPDDLSAPQALPGPVPPIALPVSAEGAEIVYIVRIKGAPEIDIIARNFKRDPATAHAAYAELCDRLPALADFQLVGASYSGEIKLAYQLAPGVQPTRSVMNEIKDKIMAIEGVAYADPDFVAHPGEDRK